MGFLPDITRIATHSTMPKKEERMTLMFSATFPDTVQHMALGNNFYQFDIKSLCSKWTSQKNFLPGEPIFSSL